MAGSDAALDAELFGLARMRSISCQVRETVKDLEEALALQKRTLGERHEDVAGTLVGVGSAYADEGETGKAVEAFDEAVAIYEGLGGAPEHKRCAAEAHCDAAQALEGAGEAAKALERLEKALALRRDADGDAYGATLELASRVASAALAQGGRERAAELHRFVVRGRRAAPSSFFDAGGSDAGGDALSDALQSLAAVLDDPAEAEPLLREALERRRERADEDPRAYLVASGALGRALAALGRADEAAPLLRDACEGYGGLDGGELDEEELDEETAAETRARVATLEAYAALLDARGDLAGALGAYAAALAVKRHEHGDESTEVADTLAVTGGIMLRARAYDGAGELLGEASQIYEAAPPGEEAAARRHADVLRSLARAREHSGAPAEAAELLERALALPGLPPDQEALTLASKAALASRQSNHSGAAELYAMADARFVAAGRSRSDTVLVQVRGARARELDRQGQASQAAKILEDVLSAEEERGDQSDPVSLVSARSNLAAVEFNLGHHERSRELYAAAVEAARASGDQLALSDALLDLCDALTTLGRHAEAADAARESLRLRDAGLGGDHPDSVAAAGRAALALDEAGDARAASHLHRRVVRFRRDDHAGDVMALADALCCLGMSYRARGMLARARRALKEALVIQTEVAGDDDERAEGTAAALAEVRSQGLVGADDEEDADDAEGDGTGSSGDDEQA